VWWIRNKEGLGEERDSHALGSDNDMFFLKKVEWIASFYTIVNILKGQ
jgi:hypothetical protein